MAEKKIVGAKRKTNVKGIMRPTLVRPKTIARRTKIRKKHLKKLCKQSPLRIEEASISQIICQSQKI
ncbi:MAG: hypothetical protein OEL84_10160 [Nitrosopumilus sp.]|nr:hypothetical protein [Nitrosopumilus sp.]